MTHFRKGQNPIGKAFKGLGEGIVKGLDAMAEADARIQEHKAEERRIEADQREFVEQAIKQYEIVVGKPFIQRGQVYDERFRVSYPPIVSNPGHPGLTWDMENKGHLINCRPNCTMHHCLVCGEESYSKMYCFDHRKR
jgi:hypothetical protein